MASGGRSGAHGVCYREWSGVRCHDLPESDGATWNPLQSVEQDSGYCHDLPESSGLMAEARLGHLKERNGFLSLQSKRGSDVFEVADESTIVGCLEH